MWPDDALEQQAGRIGPALLELIDAEKRWVHRRVERIELPNAAQATRAVGSSCRSGRCRRLPLRTSP